MVKHLLRNRDDAYADYTQSYFEHELMSRFDLQSRMTLANGYRTLTVQPATPPSPTSKRATV